MEQKDDFPIKSSGDRLRVGVAFIFSVACLILLLSMTRVPPGAQRLSIPVFPGAEGFGTMTPAGRGGRVIRVTSLEDSGPGSLRAALEATGPRIVVFEVGGVIHLNSKLRIDNPFITVAGQTAPGQGIMIRNWGIYIHTHDQWCPNVKSKIVHN
ncbi:MAG: hypothetical protein EOM62_16030 [Bacteroidia bacterium]|nr:hypothetical protein [Bacteroidia bacterium]